MKNFNVPTVIISLLISVNVLSQDAIYNFRTDSWTIDEVNSNQNVNVYVDDINPFIWDVKFNKVDINKNQMPDNVFGLLAGDFLTAFTSLKIGTDSEIAIPFTNESEDQSGEIKKCIEDIYVEDLKAKYSTYLNTLYEYQTLLMITMDSEMTLSDLVKFTTINSSLSSDYSSLKTANAQLLIKLKSDPDCIKNDSYQALSKILSQIITDASEKNITKLELLKKSADRIVKSNVGRNNIRLKVSKFAAQGDEAKIKLTFTPRKQVDSYELPLMPRMTNEKILIKSHFKVSFSPGLIFTSGLNDKKFNLSQVMVNDSTNNYRIIEEDESKLNYGISALTHFTWSRKYGGVGLNLGLGYLPKNTKIAGLLGASLIFGNDKQLILNGGIAASFSKVLSDSYDINERFPEVFEIKTKEQIQTGIWLGLSYRL